MSFVLSVDVGTSNIKASLVDEKGTLINVIRRPQTIIRKTQNAASHDPKQLISKIIDCCHVAAAGHNSKIERVVISTYQYGLVILDENKQAISNMSTLLDQRSKVTFKEFLTTCDPVDIYKKTGCPSFTQSILPRLFAIKKNNPDVIKKGRHFLSSKAFILYSFTGEMLTEASTESPSQFLNIEDLTWNQDLLDIVGIDAGCLPEIIEPTERALDIMPEIRSAIGLPEHCKILPGVYDGGAICIGMNCHQNQRAVSNIGTSGMLRVLSDKLVLDDPTKMRFQPFYLMEGKYLIGGATNNAALPLKWFKENLLELSYDEIDRLAQNSPIGSHHLFFLPYLTGERDINIGSICSSSFFGLRENHQRADFIRSVLEGVAFNLNMIKESLTEGGLEISDVHIGGGGVRSAEIWVDIISNVWNLPLVKSQHDEPCLIGNAVLGFTNLKVYDSLESAGNVMTKLGRRIVPDPQIAATYTEFYDFFVDLYKSYSELYLKHANFASTSGQVCSYLSLSKESKQ